MKIDIDSSTYPGLEDTLSTDRFGTYLNWADGNRDSAIGLYTLNACLSESLYTPLHILEVALRNRIHTIISAASGEGWYDSPVYQANPIQQYMLDTARHNLSENRKQITPAQIVATLTFAFWTSMLGKEYENLWQTMLKDIGKREDGKGLQRKDFSKPLVQIRLLRNRLAHHETVLHWDLRKHYSNILLLTGWLSPVAAEWSKAHSRFESLYPKNGILLHRETS